MNTSTKRNLSGFALCVVSFFFGIALSELYGLRKLQPSPYDFQFWKDVLATTTGVVLSFILAVLSSFFFLAYQQRKKRENFLESVELSLEKNEWLLSRVEEEVRDGKIPTFPVDMVLLDSLACQSFECISEKNGVTTINDTRYELMHMNSKLAMLRTLIADSGTKTQLLDSVLKHAGELRGGIKNAIRIIRSEIC